MELSRNNIHAKLFQEATNYHIRFFLYPFCNHWIKHVCSLQCSYLYLDLPYYQGDGPLAGIYSAMTSCETEWLLTLPVDVPFMKSDVLEVLLREMGDEIDAVIPIVDEKMQVLVGLFRCTIKDKIKTQLDQEERRIDHLLEKIATRYVKIDDTKAFFNINRQSEYHKYVANIEH